MSRTPHLAAAERVRPALAWPLGIWLVLGLALTLGPAAGQGPSPENRLIEVTGDSVLVRDLAGMVKGISPPLASMDQPIVTGLRPAERRSLTASELAARLAELGVSGRPSVGVTLLRRSRVLASEEILAAGERAIRESLAATHRSLVPGDEVIVAPLAPPRSYLAPVGPLRIEVAVQPPKLPGGLWVVEVTAQEDGAGAANRADQADLGWKLECTVRYRARVVGQVLVARRTVRRHESLREDDIAIEARDITPLRGRPLRRAAEVSGTRASRPISAGSAVTDECLEPIPVVRKGDLLTVTAQVGAISVSTQALALSDGGPGDIIRVRTARGAEMTNRQLDELPVRVSGPGRAEVVILP